MFVFQAYQLYMLPESQDLVEFSILGQFECRVTCDLAVIVPGLSQTLLGVLCYITHLPVVMQTVCGCLVLVLYYIASTLFHLHTVCLSVHTVGARQKGLVY